MDEVMKAQGEGEIGSRPVRERTETRKRNGEGTMPQTGWSRVRFPMSLAFPINLILPDALYPRSLLNL
jgi:hypothetical protein